MKHLFVILSLSLLFISCSKDTIDSSSKESFESSVKKLSTSLSLKDKKAFKESIDYLFSTQTKTPTPLSIFNEKSVADIIAMHHQHLQTAMTQKKHKLHYLNKLLETYTKGFQTKRLSQFKIINARVSQAKNHYTGMVKITLDVHNMTAFEIKKVTFIGVVDSQGEPEPWLKEMFTYTLSQPLQAGKKANWTFYAQTENTQWDKLPDPEIQTSFIVTASMLRDAQNNIIAADYKDKISLAKLKELTAQLAKISNK